MEAQQLAQAVEKLSMSVEHLRQVNALNAASVTILAFDWLLMLDLEYVLIWKAKWNTTKILYLLTRYQTFIDTPFVMYRQLGFRLSEPTCRVVFIFTVFSFGFGMITAELVFTLRTWAVWGKSKKLTSCLISGFVALVSAVLIILVFYVRSMTHQASPVPGIVGCVSVPSSQILSVDYGLLMVYDACLMILMIIRGAAAFKSLGGSYLARVVYSDGIIYYVYVFALSLINVLIIIKLPKDYETLLLMFERVVHSVLACRVVLHIRQQVSTDVVIVGQSGVVPAASYVSTEMRFRHTSGVESEGESLLVAEN